MSYLQLLNCTGKMSTCCSDYGLARILSIFKSVFSLIQMIAPIVLIVMLTFQLTAMVVNPDEKKNMKRFINKFMAAFAIFSLPTTVNVILGIVPSSYELFSCWKSAGEVDNIIKANKSIYIRANKSKAKDILNDPSKYEKGNPKKDKDKNKPSKSKGDGSILLIAGHSYPPYCSTGGKADCRGMAASGYDETDQTRILVKLIKSELDKLGVKSDIANALMAGDNDKMNKSFYIECSLGTALCNKYDWGKYKFVLEIHFNASGAGTASGTMLVKNTAGYSTPADQDIVDAVVKNTGHRRYGDYVTGIANISYFQNKKVPITYLETEFYDNGNAMKTYTSKKEIIAKDIAKAIKKHYG